ncbi:MAG: hypothetical protein K5651_09685 [Bacteroidales bacterium]|nr:hypothetical protein [Bacteroidales bacterium]
MSKRILLVWAALMLAFPLAAQMNCDRGYVLQDNPVKMVRKGGWMLGGSVGFTGSTSDNRQFLIVNGISGRLYDIDVSPRFCYMIGDNMGIGCAFSYRRNFFNAASARLSMDGLDLNVKNYYLDNHSYLFSGFYRYYIPFGSGRFGAYVDAELSLGGRQHRMMDNHAVDEKGTYGVGFQGAVGAYAGVLAFFTSHFAMDVRVGLLSLNYSSEKQTHNQVATGTDHAYSGHFMIDLLALRFGLYYYL